MSDSWSGEELLQPISAEAPCGQNLEDTQLLASFDAYRLYGRTKPLEPSPDGDDGAPKTIEDRDERPPDWAEVKEKSLEALRVSKDLRLLVHLGTALLRTDGLPAFVETINVAAQWLEERWDQTYPLVDGDGVVRRSALNCFADPIAVIDRLRRAPVVSSRQHGQFSLRDIDIASGQLAPGRGDAKVDEARINAAFAEMPQDELTAMQQRVSRAVNALKRMDTRMREEVGVEAAPEFDPLAAQLAKLDRVLRAQLSTRPGAAVSAEEAEGGPAGTSAPATGFSGAVRSREEAVRALDAVADYFRRNEPSSPVPLLCDRAKRLISMNFLDVLADIAPDAVGQARAAGGLKD